MRRVLELVRGALDQPATQRQAWLARRCAGDDALRREVLAMLALDEIPAHLAPAWTLTQQADTAAADPLIGARIDRFRIDRRLGSGGMGTVYRAEPVDGVARQTVALKLVKRGMDSEEIVARFLRERTILARLEHPHIARLLDGGISGDGRPWFALELVDGQSLLEWCDARTLDLAARVDLFLDACDAVAYAHRNLVVHRDLKPANMLVTADGTLKLLDFGIAKLLDGAAGATRGGVLMTPEYAAPEQFSAGSITTQTDVFQLGVVLHELLAGVRPAQTQRGADVAAQLRELRMRDPVALETLARARGCGAGALLRALRGDLGRIVRRAMQVDVAQRYASVGALADDLQRWRRGVPVSATADTLRYRMRMFLRRHRVAVASTAAVALALLVGIGVAWHEAWQRAAAERDAGTALAMLEDVFLGADPYAAKGSDTRALDLVSRARERALAQAADNPALAARLLTEIGGVYVSLGDRDQAEPTLRAALAAGERAGAAALVHTEGARARLAHYTLVVDGNTAAAGDLDLAIERLRGAGEPALRTLAQALDFKADAAFNRGDYAAIPQLSALALEAHRRAAGEPSSEFATALGNQASLLRAIDRADEAMAPAARAYAMMQRLGTAAPSARLYVEQQYAGALAANGRNREAEPLLRQALARARATPGTDHLLVEGIRWELANLQLELGEFDTAARALRELAAAAADKSANGAAIHNALGHAELGRNDALAALAAFERAFALLCESTATSPPCVAIGLNRADAWVQSGRLEQADSALAELDARIGADAQAARARWRVVAAALRLAQGDADAAARILAPRAQQARAAGAHADIADALALVLWARIARQRGEVGAELADLHAAERRMDALWEGQPAALIEVRARIRALEHGAPR